MNNVHKIFALYYHKHLTSLSVPLCFQLLREALASGLSCAAGSQATAMKLSQQIGTCVKIIKIDLIALPLETMAQLYDHVVSQPIIRSNFSST